MTSTATGLPDRYRPLDQVGPDEETPTGVIRSWRARDRVLNRDVALRVHTPGGAPAREWITRALTAGGLATPALAMVYDAAEGTGGSEPGGAAYVVNEWIEGTRLSERLAEGPLPERDARAVVRRLAEGVAEAHRVGLPVGGLTPDRVVLRPGGLVGLLAVPAASGTEKGDIAALGELLELCLTGSGPGADPGDIASPDLAALVRRARSTDPGTGLSSVSTMASLLADRPRTGPQEPARPEGGTDGSWVKRLRDRREAAAALPDDGPHDGPHDGSGDGDHPVRLDRHTLPPVPARPARPPAAASAVPPVAPTVAARPLPPPAGDDALDWGGTFTAGERADDAPPARSGRRRLAVIGLPLLALLLVVAAALWLGHSVSSVAGSVGDVDGSTPSAGASAGASSGASSGTGPAASAPAAGSPATIADASVFDPFGDGQPENDDDVPRTHDGDPATGWSTLAYRGSADFGNLKPGVGVVYDLGDEQQLAGVTITTSTPGVTVEVRTGGTPSDDLDAFRVAASGRLTGTDDLAFDAPVSSRYVLVWVTGLVDSGDGFSAELDEVAISTAG